VIRNENRDGAEGATAPETLRPKDRGGVTLWKAAPASAPTEGGNPAKAGEIFQVSGQRGRIAAAMRPKAIATA
jgi:hypothetical protein